MPDLSREDCTTIVKVLTSSAEELPAGARSLKARLRRTAREWARAGSNYEHAEDNEANPEIRACGALEPGERIMLGAGALEVRRVTDTGIEINQDGRWVWENVQSRTSPVVVVDGIER